jgi:hypothetical protein
MNHHLTLMLHQVTADLPGLQFRLLMRNDSLVKLVLPLPEFTDLRFSNDLTAELAQWRNTEFTLSSGGWSGLILEPGKAE